MPHANKKKTPTDASNTGGQVANTLGWRPFVFCYTPSIHENSQIGQMTRFARPAAVKRPQEARR